MSGKTKTILIVFLSIILLGSTFTAMIPYAYANGEPANLVLGQIGLTSAVTNISDLSLNVPLSSAVDSPGNLWVVDSNNNRVLRYNTPSSSGEAADIVLGQPNFASNAANAGGLSASSLNNPRAVVIDALGNLWVSDVGNHRVLMFSDGDTDPNTSNFLTGQAASLVIGQPDFTSNAPNNGGILASRLSGPQGIAVVGSTTLFVADAGNNRVLRYSSPFSDGQAADRVLGQSSFTTNTANSGGLDASALKSPQGLAVDGAGNLFVADAGNNRVLRYTPPLATDGQDADLVLGQPNFASSASNSLSVTASTLNNPQGIATLGSTVWVADGSNNRLVRYSSPSANGQAADLVLGQTLFTSGDPNSGGLSASSIFSPQGITVAGSNIWAADSGNNRVLRYTSPVSGAAANLVLGQGGFTTNTAGSVGLSATSLNFPRAVAVDASGNVWTADTANNRVLKYPAPSGNGPAAVVVLGQPDFTSNAPNNGGLAARSLASPRALAIDINGDLWVADTNNHRVLRFNDGDSDPGTSNFASFQNANLVLGQPNFGSNTANNGGLDATSLNFPQGLLAVDMSGTIIIGVADTANNRVLAFMGPAANDAAAGLVFGQADFTSNAPNRGGPVSASTLFGPRSVSTGPGGLVVADTGNNRVLSFDPSSGPDATLVLGQPDFVSNAPNNGGISASRLNAPQGLAVDGSGRLFVADSGNNRVLRYPTSPTDGQAALLVLGQTDFVTALPNTGGLSASTLSTPSGMTVAASGDLWVADTSNNRVLRYQSLPTGETDSDGDGFTPSAGDCDDSDPLVFPGAPELPDGKDNNCNGMVDEGMGGSDQIHQDTLNEVRRIEEKLDGTRNSLVSQIADQLGQIANQLGQIAQTIQSLVTSTAQILGILQDPRIGLGEIKEEIENIEGTVTDLDADHEDIKNEIDQLGSSIGGIPAHENRVDIAVTRFDGSDKYIVLMSMFGTPVDATIDKILVINNNGEGTLLTPDKFTLTNVDTGLKLLEINKKGLTQGIKAIELSVTHTATDGTVSHGVILFQHNVEKNIGQ